MRRLLDLDIVKRNEVIIKVVAVSFLTLLYFSIILTVATFAVFPWLLEWLKSLMPTDGFPSPFTTEFFCYILSNNLSHFWNPPKMLVWIPFLGTVLLGLELSLNAIVIGVAVVTAGMKRGALFPMVGIVPHGILEIPAFILQFVCFALLHITIIQFLLAKIVGEKTNSAKLKQGVKDAVIFGVVAVLFFTIAALIETYVTPFLLGLFYSC